MPETSKKESMVLHVESVGPGVEGFKEGDIVAYEVGKQFHGGVFVRIRDVLGRLVPGDAPNSAVAPPKLEDLAQAD